MNAIHTYKWRRNEWSWPNNSPCPAALLELWDPPDSAKTLYLTISEVIPLLSLRGSTYLVMWAQDRSAVFLKPYDDTSQNPEDSWERRFWRPDPPEQWQCAGLHYVWMEHSE